MPDVWFVYRTNPGISFWDTKALGEKMARFPFMVAFAYTHDETNHFADVLLPDATDLESLQLWRVGGTKYQESFWDHQGFALRQPVVAPHGQARDLTDVATELAQRTGLADKYFAAINKGAGGVPLKSEHGDFSLDPHVAHSREAIWDAVCRAASAEVSDGAHSHGLEWWKEHGLATKPYPRRDWYLLPTMVKHGLRFELPYQERLMRVGAELGRRLHENDMHWWDTQLKEYQALPVWKDFPGLWEAVIGQTGGRAQDYPFWLLTARSMQYAWGANAGMQLMKEVADNVTGHRGVVINSSAAARLGIADGDAIEIATPQAQGPRPCRRAPGHPARYAAADRPVRPLGHAAGQGLRRAEHELAGHDVDGSHRRHRLGRRHRAREDREGNRRSTGMKRAPCTVGGPRLWAGVSRTRRQSAREPVLSLNSRSVGSGLATGQPSEPRPGPARRVARADAGTNTERTHDSFRNGPQAATTRWSN